MVGVDLRGVPSLLRPRAAGHARGKRLEQLRCIDRIKAILLPAKLAGHLNMALLRNDAVGLLRAQADDHGSHFLAAAGAGEARAGCTRYRLETDELFLPEQTAQNRLGIQREQFVAAQAGCQQRDTPVVFIPANRVFVGSTEAV